MHSTPTVVALDIIGTTFSLDPMRKRLVGLGLPDSALDLWFSMALRDAFALAAADSFAPFKSVLGQALDQVLAVHGAIATQDQKTWVLEGMKELPPHPDAAEALQLLANARIRVFAVTNGAASSTQALLDSAGLARFVERVVSVDEVEFSKPRPEVYLHAARMAGIEPDALALVASHAWDIHGAKAAGLLAGFVSRGRSYPSIMREPDVRGETLADVARLFAGA